jgi:hypothetical protein
LGAAAAFLSGTLLRARSASSASSLPHTRPGTGHRARALHIPQQHRGPAPQQTVSLQPKGCANGDTQVLHTHNSDAPATAGPVPTPAASQTARPQPRTSWLHTAAGTQPGPAQQMEGGRWQQGRRPLPGTAPGRLPLGHPPLRWGAGGPAPREPPASPARPLRPAAACCKPPRQTAGGLGKARGPRRHLRRHRAPHPRQLPCRPAGCTARWWAAGEA